MPTWRCRAARSRPPAPSACGRCGALDRRGPQLARFALPGYANIWQVLVKSTAVVSVIGLQDLVGLANDAGKTARQPFLFFVAVLLFYLLVTWISTTAFDRLERRFSRGLARAH